MNLDHTRTFKHDIARFDLKGTQVYRVCIKCDTEHRRTVESEIGRMDKRLKRKAAWELWQSATLMDKVICIAKWITGKFGKAGW